VDAERVTAQVLATKKYAMMDVDAVRRVCRDACARHAKTKDAVKAAKTALHGMNAAFVGDGAHQAAARVLAAAGPGLLRDKAAALGLLRLHASSAERIAYLDEVCTLIADCLGQGRTLLDLGCGFQPFALPWYPRLPDAYVAVDMHRQTVALLNDYFARIGRPAYRALVCDLGADIPAFTGDCALLFKLLPLLERQRKGGAMRLFSRLRVPRALVSFQLKSLGGRQKGMLTHYAAWFERELPAGARIIRRAVVGDELFYGVEKALPLNPENPD
jgi:16S rRNA (guanine(1405)-N(7))-methyltransferase